MATEQGIIKKISLDAYSRPMKTGIIALTLGEGDRLVRARLCADDQAIMIGTSQGYAIRFDSTLVRPVGRPARGVRGINLRPGDRVVDMAVVRQDDVILTICARGYGKRTAVTEYRATGRGGKGVINIRCTAKNGPVVDMLSVTEEDDLILMTQGGKMVRIPAGQISLIGRSTQGVRCMRLSEGDRIVSSSIVAEEKVAKGNEEDD